MSNKHRLLPRFQTKALTVLVSLIFGALVFALLWGFGKFNPTGIDTSTPTGIAQKIACCGGVSVLFAVLLAVVAYESMRRSGTPDTEHPVWYYPLLAGFLSLSCMCVAYSFLGMWPLGQKTAMMVDMHHQYAPLLAGMRDSLLHGGSPFYSFKVGLGANYLSLFAYYLASPLNLFLTLFPERLLAEGILFITLIKNALCGASFAFFLQQVYRKKNLLIPAMSVAYTLMMYMIAYSWNIMWLDVVMMLPIVVYGFERLMHTGHYKTYVLSLAYTLFVNYYIAFMLCIFLVLYYIAYLIRSRRTGHESLVSFGRFAGFSALGGGLAAFLLVPVYFALKTTSASGGSLPNIGSDIDFFDLLGRCLADTSPTIRSGNLPNIYCGVLTMFCLPLFATNKGIHLRRRLTYMAFWLVMSFSFLVNWSNLGWHGLHAPNDLPYRFSFLYSFLMLIMAYEVLINLKSIKLPQVMWTFVGLTGFLVLEERFGDSVYDFEIIYINLALVAIYTIILALASHKVIRQQMACALLLLTITAEMTIGGGNTIRTLNSNEYYTAHEDYVDNITTDLIRDSLKKAQELGDKTADGDFYRMELLPRRTCVDTALFHYRGLTSFSSSNYYTTTKMLGGLGYAINGVNSHLYESFVPLTDSLLGIRYLVSNTEWISHPQLQMLTHVNKDDSTYYIYENPDALGLGFVCSSPVKNFIASQYNPFESQEDLLEAMVGTGDRLYTLYDTSTNFSNASVNGSSFSMNPSDEDTSAVFNTTVPIDGQLYIYPDCSAADSLSISYGNESWSMTPYEPYIIDAGAVTAGTTVTLTVSSDTACSGNFYVATINTARYRQALDKLAVNQLVIDRFSDQHLKGTITSNRKGVLFTSIPYDRGWQVKIDGKAVKTFSIGEAFLAVDIDQGEHTVELSYTPYGFLPGMLISLICLAILIFLTLIQRKAIRLRRLHDQENLETVQPIQGDFVVSDPPLSDTPNLPDSLEKLTQKPMASVEESTESPEKTITETSVKPELPDEWTPNTPPQ